MFIANNDTDVYLRGDSGCIASSYVGGHMFNCGVWPSFRKRFTEWQRRGVAGHLNAQRPLDERDIKIAATGFADDCGAAVAGTSITAPTRCAKNIDDVISDTSLDNIILAQNTDKLVKTV